MQGTAGAHESEAELKPLAVAALLLLGIFTTIGLFSPGLVLPQIERHFAETANVKLLTELAGTIASFAFAFGAPLGGVLIARFGVRPVVVPALALFAVAGAAPALLDDLHAILAARAVVGFATGGIFTGALAGLGSLPAAKRAKMFGWFSVAGGAAAIFLFPVVGALGHIGWRPAFYVNLIALPAILLALAIPQGLARTGHGGGQAGPTGGGQPLLNPAMIGLLAVAVLAGMAMLVGPIYAPLRLAELGITDPRQAAIPVTVGSIAAVFASGSYGWLHGRFGVGGVTALTLLVIAAMMLVAGLADGAVVFGAAVVVESAMVALIAPNVSAAALEYSAPGKGSQAMGLANGVMFGAQLAFPFLAAAIRADAGLGGVFIAFAAASLLCGLVALVRSRRQGSLAAA